MNISADYQAETDTNATQDIFVSSTYFMDTRRVSVNPLAQMAVLYRMLRSDQ